MVIKDAQFVISNTSVANCPAPNLPEYAFIGRSNVGKSSLINMITGKKNLAKTSATPGKTQLINHFLINNKWYLVDLPGYGYAKRSQQQRKEWKKMISEYLQKRENLVTLFLLIDSRHEPQKIDLDFVNQLGQWRIPFSLVFTKADKSTQKDSANNVNSFLKALSEYWEESPPHFLTSAEKFTGLKKLLNFIEEQNKIFEEYKKGMP